MEIYYLHHSKDKVTWKITTNNKEHLNSLVYLRCALVYSIQK